jgi:hypothetical protein
LAKSVVSREVRARHRRGIEPHLFKSIHLRMMSRVVGLILLMGVSTVAFHPSMPALAPRIRRASSVSMSGHVEHEHNSRRQFLGTSASAAVAATLTTATPALAKGKNSVSFSNVKNGDTVPRKFTYKFDVTGYELSPAAAGLIEGTGHHHLVIDGPKAFVDPGEAIPFDATHKHFGKAQTEGELELEPGKHKLTLQFANANHESYGKEFAKTITVNVKDA